MEKCKNQNRNRASQYLVVCVKSSVNFKCSRSKSAIYRIFYVLELHLPFNYFQLSNGTKNFVCIIRAYDVNHVIKKKSTTGQPICESTPKFSFAKPGGLQVHWSTRDFQTILYLSLMMLSLAPSIALIAIPTHY